MKEPEVRTEPAAPVEQLARLWTATTQSSQWYVRRMGGMYAVVLGRRRRLVTPSDLRKYWNLDASCRSW